MKGQPIIIDLAKLDMRLIKQIVEDVRKNKPKGEGVPKGAA